MAEHTSPVPASRPSALSSASTASNVPLSAVQEWPPSQFQMLASLWKAPQDNSLKQVEVEEQWVRVATVSMQTLKSLLGDHGGATSYSQGFIGQDR
jgi:hypothetical protein